MKRFSRHVRLMLFLCSLSLLALLAYRAPHLTAWQAEARVPATSTQLQILIPLYSYPNHYDPSTYIWDDIATAATTNSQVSITAIINPSNGPGSGPPNSDYDKGLGDLRKAGVTMVGYVSTDYRNRSLDDIKADVDLYDQHFNINGIFFDEVATDKLSDYQILYEYVKTRPNLDKVIINPGVNLDDERYISAPASDIAIIFEDYSTQWPDYRPLTYMANYSAERFAMLVHSVPNDTATMKSHIDFAKQHNIGYVYVTDDILPTSKLDPNHPWDALPSFWSEEVDYIQQLNSTPKPTATSTPANTPTSTPSATPIPTNTPSNTPSPTPVPTNTPTNTPSVTSIPTNTPTSVPSGTPIPTNTPTSVPSGTSIPTNTPTSAPLASQTPTSVPTSTNTPLVPTNTPPVPTSTNTPIPTPISGKVEPQILIPLYNYPNWSDPDNYIWDDVAAANSQVPITAIINPNSGPGGPPNADYVRGLSDLRNAGVTIVGYVYTDYGNRSLDEVKADVDLYDQHFDIHGIFFDQAASSASKVEYYRELYDYVKSRSNLDNVIINPGNSTNEGYIGSPPAASDVAVIFANDSSEWENYQPSAYVANYPAHRFAMLAYGVPDVATMQSHIELAKQRNIGYLYLTDDTLPNPWDTLPTFWQEEVAYIAQSKVDPTSTPIPTATNTTSPSATPAASATPTFKNALYLPVVIR